MGVQAHPAAVIVVPRPSRLSHPAVAVAGSALLPGLGQILVGRWVRGLALMSPTLLLGVGLAALAAQGRANLAGLALTPRFLWGVFVVDIAVLAWRLFAVFDAYRLARDDHRGSVGALAAGWLAVVVLFTTVPHLVLGSSTLATADAVTTVFQAPAAAPEPVAALPARVLAGSVTTRPPPTTAVPTTTTPPPPTTIAGTFVAGLAPVPTVSESEEIEGALTDVNPMAGVERITILLAGADGGPGRNGFRTDAMMVVSLDLQTGQALIFGFPRNMTFVPLPSWMEAVFDPECKCYPEPLNHLYVRTKNWTKTFPDEVDPGMAALREVLAHLMGIPIDHYVRVDMRGFVRLVDALGGVTVNVRVSIADRVSPVSEDEEWIEIDVEPGRRRLNGHEALAYARSRYGSTDYNRMARQRCVLSALAARSDPVRILTRMPRIAEVVKWSTVTDIEYPLLPVLARHAARIDAEDIATVGFVPNYYVSEWVNGSWAPDVERIRHTVRKMMAGDYSSNLVTSGGESECGA